MYRTFFIHAPVDGHIGCFHSEESQKGKNKCILTQICGIWKTVMLAAAAAKSLQSCPTLCDPIDGSPPGSPTPGILQAGTLEWVAFSFFSA